jgi:hypothetical protein
VLVRPPLGIFERITVFQPLASRSAGCGSLRDSLYASARKTRHATSYWRCGVNPCAILIDRLVSAYPLCVAKQQHAGLRSSAIEQGP